MRQVILASALFSILIILVASIAPISAVLVKDDVVGDWTGKIEGDYTYTYPGVETYHIKKSVDVSFTVDKNGLIYGNGSGWVEYSKSTYGRFDCYAQGRRDITFKVLGDINKDTGNARITIAFVFDVNADCGQRGGAQSMGIAPFEYWRSREDTWIKGAGAEGELKEGAIINVSFGSDSPYVKGYDRLVIQRHVVVKDCPKFTITPTMPPANDPRGFATPGSDASFRLAVVWGGATPTQVQFKTAGGGGTVQPKFVFNPATMQSSKINVILDVVVTKDAAPGNFPITVTGTVTVPDQALTCIANAAVTLVVGQSRASDFTLLAHAGQVQVTPVDPTPEGGPATLVTTGHNGSATIEIANATLDIGKNTEVRYYNRIVNVPSEADSLLMQLIKERVKDKPGVLEQALDIGWRQVQDAKYKLAYLGTDYIRSVTTTKVLGCALVSMDTNNHDACDGTGTIILINGQVHYVRPGLGKTPEEKWHNLLLILTPNQIVIPLGTQLTLNSHPFVSSSLTVLEGSALVIDVISKQVQIVNASQRLDMTISYSANPPFSNGQSASLVLGQTGFTTNTAASTQSGLRQPDALRFDAAGNLWVVDANNNRVLEFNPPFANGMSASLVIGQSTFSAGSNATSQKGLWFPLDIAFDASGNLWIVDAGNSRILRFSPPFTNGMNANLVIGQSSFTTKVAATTQSGLRGPEGMAFDSSGNLWIADRGNNRILEFSPPFSNGMNAAVVIGQPTFTSGGATTSQNGLFNPCCVAFDLSGNLWEAEWGNNRVMKFAPPFSNGMKATLVIGQSSFTTSRPAITQDGLGGPRHITFDASGDLWVADFSGNRVLEFAPPFSNGMNAISVIGKTGFTTNTAATTQTGMTGAHGVAFDSSGNLWTAEWYNNRILEFQATKPVSSQSRISSTTLDSIPQWWESKLSYPITVDAKQFMVNVRTNSTVSNLSFSRQGRSISLTVNGVSGTKGYVNMTWPKDLLDGTFVVTVDGKQVPFILKESITMHIVYASYGHSQRTITIMALAQPAPRPQPAPDPAPIQPVAPPAQPAPQPQIKEVIKEVPKEVVKEVIKQIPKEVIEEVPVVARPADTINPLIYTAIGTVVFLGVVGGILLSRRNKAISTKITCSSCGRQNAVGAQFCKSCGNSVWKEFKAYG